MTPLRTAVAGLVVAGIAVTGLAGTAALAAARDLQHAQAVLVTVRASGSPSPENLSAVEDARRAVARADERLSSWPVDVLAAVPVLGRSWDVERTVTTTAAEVLTGVSVLAERLPELRARAGGVDLQSVTATSQVLDGPADRALDGLHALESTSAGLTPPQVQQALTDARAALTPAVQGLHSARTGLDLLGGLLGRSGPRHVLVMLQNNAELRGTGGYSAAFATGTLSDGRVALDPLRDIQLTADPPERARTVAAPREYLEDYGPRSGNTTMWRSWNMSPHVPHSAEVGARVAGEILGTEPDVVVLLDVPAMAALASLGDGGVTLPNGSTVSPEQLTRALLVDAYAEAGGREEEQDRRRAELQAAATTAVSRLLAGDVPVAYAARAISRLVGGRHLSLWSARPDEQRALVQLGAAGEVEAPDGSDLLHVSVNNLGSNKLDVYVDREVTVDVTLARDHAVVHQRVRFTNRAPEGLVPYVAGYVRPGTAVSLVELSLPPDATAVAATVDGDPWRGTLRRGATRQRLATRLEQTPGETVQLDVRYRQALDDGTYRARLIPQPLAEDAPLDLTVRAAAGLAIDEVSGPGTTREGFVHRAGPLGRVEQLSVGLRPPSRWQRVQQLWTSPVSVG